MSDGRKTISFDVEKMRRLKKAFDSAVERNDTSFEFGGEVYVTRYAKYLLDYLQGELNPTRTMHSSITQERVIDAIVRRDTVLDNPGFCLACGEEQDGCEPDARQYPCDACGEKQVYGAEEILLMSPW